MNFRRFYMQWLRLLLAIYGVVSLLAGYWDVRLSDARMFHHQLSSLHYIRTLQAHFLLAILLSAVMAALFASYHWKRSQTLDRERTIAFHLSFGIALFLFVILGIKLHLVWLETHLFDPEGLLWTAGLLVCCIVLFGILRWFIGMITARASSSRIAALVFLVAALGTAADAYLSFSRQHASTARTGPNVLLIIADTLRWDHVSAYGKVQNTTPNIDRLAREGVLYEHAISASPWTTPAHASIFTGQYPSRNGVEGRNIFLDPAATTLAQHLTRNGYQTAGFINNVYIRKQTGLAKGFQQYEEFWGRNAASSLGLLLELLQEKMAPRLDSGARQTRKSVEHWVDRDWRRKAPFFLFVHLMEPHAPYGTPPDHLAKFLPRGVTPAQALQVNQDPEPYICKKVPMNEKDFAALRGLYNSDIRYMDDQLGSLLESFRSRGLLDNTLVVVTSDHGEHFGDHNLMSHELSVYDALIRVPLILRHPATIQAGTRVSAPVQTLDLFPSFLSFLKVDAAKLEMQGVNLLPSSFQRAHLPFTFAEYNNARAVDKIERLYPGISDPLFRRKILRTVRSADLKLVWGDDGTRELYDLRKDPDELHNEYAQDPERVRILENVLQRWSSSFKASRFYKQEEVSKEALEELRALGYVQ